MQIMNHKKFTKEELRDKLDGNELDLSLCNLSKVPVREIASLPKATALDLSCNVLTTLPGTFSTLTQLTKLDLSKNKLTELPMDFGHLVNLERLDLYCNNLTALPTSFIHLKKLTWLDLKGNPIQTLLPDVVGNCLSAQECKQCAHSMISYLKMKNAEQERIRQKKLEAEREKRVFEETNAAKERELRKRQKRLEKQGRREAFEAMEKQKKLMAEKAEGKLRDNEGIKDEPHSKHEEPRKDKLKSPLLFLLIVVVCFLVICGLLFYCNENNCLINVRELLK